MKRENPDLYAALLLGILLHTLLCAQARYGARAGLLALPFSAAALTLAAVLFARAWRQLEGLRAPRWGLAAVLAASSAFELLRFWQLIQTAYGGAVTMLGVCLMLLLPVVYLRRVSAIAQTANVVLSLAAVAGVVLLISIAGELRPANLQPGDPGQAGWRQALLWQCSLYPEFLLPALWPDPDKRGPHTAARLAVCGTVFSAVVHLILELYAGAGARLLPVPVHTAAQAGTLSLFKRLEWLQLILWSMMVTVKLALYLYAAVRLLGGRGNKKENNAVGLDRFPCYFLLMAFLCAAWRKADTETFFVWQSRLLWLFAAAVILGGGLQYLCGRKKRC